VDETRAECHGLTFGRNLFGLSFEPVGNVGIAIAAADIVEVPWVRVQIHRQVCIRIVAADVVEIP
jgi:hypothetical protein